MIILGTHQLAQARLAELTVGQVKDLDSCCVKRTLAGGTLIDVRATAIVMTNVLPKLRFIRNEATQEKSKSVGKVSKIETQKY